MHQYHQIVERYFDAWSTGDLDAFDELLAPDYINHTPSLPDHPGPEGLKKIVTAIRQGIPDLSYKILHIAAEGDLVAVHTLVTGTHTGTLFGQAPTGKKISVHQMQFERIKDGKIVEHWRVTDEALLQQQIDGNAIVA
jgi:steroid delta-isomerase-like uncharacterized protein